MKICSKCGDNDSQKHFRKNRNQCINCYNAVRRNGFKNKINIEDSILKEYKQKWYSENKDKILEEGKIRYLKNRENRLKLARDNYYNEDKIFSHLLRRAKSRSKEMNISFDLDFNFIENLYTKQNKKCAITYIDFSFNKEETFRRPFVPSIDRVNSKLGYTKDNVRLVCAVVNLSLNEFGDQVFDKMCRAYVENFICCR